jgi:hypothetical protein
MQSIREQQIGSLSASLAVTTMWAPARDSAEMRQGDGRWGACGTHEILGFSKF